MNPHFNVSTAAGSGPKAEPLGVKLWFDAAGQPLDPFDLAQMGSGYKLLFCYQHACPGCHLHGFPSLIELIDQLRGQPIRFAVIQTVFEDWAHNSVEAMQEDQRRYALPVPFGHDAGDDKRGSVLMRRYGNGGTPWFILIDPANTVLHSHFRIDVEKTVALIRRAGAHQTPATPPGVPNWDQVIHWANQGNPPPPRKVILSDAEWRQRLTPDQYHITREGGTEPAHSSAMCAFFEPGRYRCVCCDTELFDAGSKYQSRSGWPSFTQPVEEGVVAYHMDTRHGMRRIEVTCQVCDAHLGHVFPDGPPPSGLRYCINAIALVRTP